MSIRMRKPQVCGDACCSGVVSLAAVRDRQRLGQYRERVQHALQRNRRAVQRLHDSGLIFTRHGTRVGRELLLTHQRLLRVADLLAGVRRAGGDVLTLADEVEALLEKASETARRHRSLFEPGGAS